MADLEKWKAQLQESDCTVLPTTSDRWVTLGNESGFVCVCDDEKISKEFAEAAEKVHFLCLNASVSGSTASRSGSADRVKRLYDYLGVPLLSQVSYLSLASIGYCCLVESSAVYIILHPLSQVVSIMLCKSSSEDGVVSSWSC